VRQNQVNSYLTINQPLPTDGNLYIRSGVQNFIDYNAEDRLAQVSSSIGLRQPIDAFYGYNNIRASYKRAELNYDLAQKRLKREELNLVYDVSQAFYRLLSYSESLNIAVLSMGRQQEAYDIARSKYQAGLIREVESLQMEVDLDAAVNNHDIALSNYNAQLGVFKESLGIDLADSVRIKAEIVYNEVYVDVEMAVRLALEHRLELKENEIQIDLQKMQIKQRKAAGMINGDILLNYNFIGVNKSPLSYPLEQAFNDTWLNLQNRPGSFGIGFTVNIPLLDWGENRARVHSAEASLSQYQYVLDAERVTIERDVRSTVDRLQSSLRRVLLLEKSVKVAERSFEISRQRYSNGDIDSQAMALERERLNTAYNSRLDAFISYKLLLSDLMRKTFYDFEKGEPLV
jgi:outer membrane protein TolC